MTSRLVRSALYVPAANSRALAKAPTLGADAIIHDLEDSVAPEAKTAARAALAEAEVGAALRIVRLNAEGTPWHEDDVIAAVDVHPFALLLPKAATPEDIWALRRRIALRRPRHPIAVWAMIETPAAVLNAPAISEALGPDGALVLGLNDLARETGMVLTKGRAPFQVVLTMTLLAARQHGAMILDGVFNAVSDSHGFEAECAEAKTLGFDGKTVVHPTQVQIANAVFAPAIGDIAEAQAIVAAFAEPTNASKGVISLNGRMVERLHLTMAEALLAKAELIAKRDQV